MGIVKNAKPRFQPKHLVLPKLDKSNPIAKRGLYEGYILHQQGMAGYDFVGKRNYSGTDDPTWTPEYVDFSTDKFIELGTRELPTQMTIFVSVKDVSSGSWKCIAGAGSGNPDFDGWAIIRRSGSTAMYCYYRNVLIAVGGSLPYTGEHTVALRCSGTGTLDLWIDGEEAATTTGTFSGSLTQDAIIGALNSSPKRDFFDDSSLGCMYLFDQPLSDDEIRSLHNDKLQVVESKRSSFYFTPESGGNVSVNIPTGSMTFTGLAPDVLTPVSVNIPVGALTLTGLAPVASVSVLANIPAGTLSLTGFAPTVNATQNVNVDIPTGTLTLTGLVPQVVAPQSVDVPTGSLSLTGFAPAINVSILTNVPAGTMTFTGLAPTVDITDSQLVDVPTGSMLFAGFAPTVEIAGPVSVEVPTGSLTMNGFAPIILADSIVWTVQPDVTTTWDPQSDSTTIWTEV